jgi:hypothetical protein
VPTWGDYPGRSSPSLCPSPGQRAALELVTNHRRSDNAIAEAALCSHSTAAHVRHLLEEDGTIGLIEASARQARTRVPCADPLPFVPAIPPQPPELARGLCVSHPRGPRLWESTRNPTDRAEALAICGRCPVQPACADWALSLSPLLDRQIGILGGLLVSDRDRLRKARREEAATGRAARAARRKARAAPRKPARPQPAEEAPRP